MTNANPYPTVEIISIFTSGFDLHNGRGRVIERGGGAVDWGKYYIVTEGMCHF